MVDRYRSVVFDEGAGRVAVPGGFPPAATALVDELGRELGIAGLAFDGDGIVSLQIDRLTVSLAVDGDGLTLFAPVSEAEVADPSRLARALMANFLWIDSDGATLALEPQSRRLALQRRLPLAGLDCPGFVAALERFTALAESWLDGLGGDAAEDRAAMPAAWDSLRA